MACLSRLVLFKDSQPVDTCGLYFNVTVPLYATCTIRGTWILDVDERFPFRVIVIYLIAFFFYSAP